MSLNQALNSDSRRSEADNRMARISPSESEIALYVCRDKVTPDQLEALRLEYREKFLAGELPSCPADKVQ